MTAQMATYDECFITKTHDYYTSEMSEGNE